VGAKIMGTIRRALHLPARAEGYAFGGRSVTPATGKDIADARAAQARLQAQHLRVMGNWPRVNAVTGWAKEIRQTNHLVEDLEQLIGRPKRPGER
jgi:hypothetical protein